MVDSLPIDAEEPLTVSDVPVDMLERFNTNLFQDINWKIIPYDYCEETKSMAYFEVVVEGKK